MHPPYPDADPASLSHAAAQAAIASSEATVPDVDIVVIGAGPVGLALAGALARHSATAGLSVTLIDSRTRDAADRDPRVLALSHGSHALLAPLGWPEQATPIETIHVSQRGYLGRALIRHDAHRLPALGYVVRYGAIAGALREGVLRLARRAAHAGHPSGGTLTFYEQCSAAVSGQDAEGVSLTLADTARGGSTPPADTAFPSTLRARLVIHAEGARATTTPSAHAPERTRDYAQTAIVGTVRTRAPQPRVAWERFTDEGPLALLPLAESGVLHEPPPVDDKAHGNAASKRSAAVPADYALVWCQSPTQAAARMAMDDDAFLAELHRAFGDRVGDFIRIDGRATFDLALRASGALVDGRIGTIGNAAQTLHPVAGQGLNLGVRDAQALAIAIGRHGTTPIALQTYAASRQWDRRLTIGLTDALARGFTHPFPPLAHLRGIALATLDCLPGAKTWLARQMMFGQRR
jgi:2-octaprenyl-6-methoxyphenol hydroxylase